MTEKTPHEIFDDFITRRGEQTFRHSDVVKVPGLKDARLASRVINDHQWRQARGKTNNRISRVEGRAQKSVWKAIRTLTDIRLALAQVASDVESRWENHIEPLLTLGADKLPSWRERLVVHGLIARMGAWIEEGLSLVREMDEVLSNNVTENQNAESHAP